MDYSLVAGGAGIIGSNFVHHLLEVRPWTVIVLDKLTYAGNRSSLAGLPAERLELSRGHRRCGAGGRAGGAFGRRGALRRGVPQ